MDISQSIEHAISTYFSNWLEQHPYLAWSIAHPIPSLCLGLLAIFSLWGLIKAIGRGIEQIWVFLLKTPFKLLQPIFRAIWGSILRVLGYNRLDEAQQHAKLLHLTTAERIERIVDRLQTLSREQENLLQELSTLMGSRTIGSNTRSISDTQYK